MQKCGKWCVIACAFIRLNPMPNRTETEYNKLDDIDRKVLQWTLKNTPASVVSWIEYTVKSYHNLKGIEIDGRTLLREVTESAPKSEVEV